MHLIIELLGIDLNITFTVDYQKQYADTEDFRSGTLPSNPQGAIVKYRQVFEDKMGFIPDLSIIDLLFSEGPHAKEKLLSGLAKVNSF